MIRLLVLSIDATPKAWEQIEDRIEETLIGSTYDFGPAIKGFVTEVFKSKAELARKLRNG